MNAALTAAAAVAALAWIGWSEDLGRAPGPEAAWAMWRAAAAAQSSAVLSSLPVFALWTASGILAGLVLRDRVAAAGSYASPACAWIAKRATGAGLTAIAAFAAGAWRADPAVLHAVMLLQAAGWAAYLRNLPPRL